MATVRILLGIFCLAITGWSNEPIGDILSTRVSGVGFGVERVGSGLTHRMKKLAHPIEFSQPQAERMLSIARSQIGVREVTGQNDGKAVETYLNYTYLKKGAPWCASFVSWVFGQAGLAQPRTAWSPALFPLDKQVVNPAPAIVFGIYFENLKRIAHCGFVEKINGNWLTTIEGNTNIQGGREGDGVYQKLRHTKTIRYYADWLRKDRREGRQ